MITIILLDPYNNNNNNIPEELKITHTDYNHLLSFLYVPFSCTHNKDLMNILSLSLSDCAYLPRNIKDKNVVCN